MQNLPDHVVMPSITYNGWNYSLLDQVTLANFGDLAMDWTLALVLKREVVALGELHRPRDPFVEVTPVAQARTNAAAPS